MYFLVLFKTVISGHGCSNKLEFFLSESRTQDRIRRTQIAQVFFCGSVAVLSHSLKVWVLFFFYYFFFRSCGLTCKQKKLSPLAFYVDKFNHPFLNGQVSAK